jgi:hypothetical protein
MGINPRSIALLSKVESLYGELSHINNPDSGMRTIGNPDPGPQASTSWRLAFPRDISSLRAGYEQEGLLDRQSCISVPGMLLETYKALWEVLHPDGSAPTNGSFNEYEQAQFNARKQSVGFGNLVLASFTKFSDLVKSDSDHCLAPSQINTVTTFITLPSTMQQNSTSSIARHSIYARTFHRHPRLGQPAGIRVPQWVNRCEVGVGRPDRIYRAPDITNVGPGPERYLHQVDTLSVAYRPKDSHQAAMDMVNFRASR